MKWLIEELRRVINKYMNSIEMGYTINKMIRYENVKIIVCGMHGLYSINSLVSFSRYGSLRLESYISTFTCMHGDTYIMFYDRRLVGGAMREIINRVVLPPIIGKHVKLHGREISKEVMLTPQLISYDVLVSFLLFDYGTTVSSERFDRLEDVELPSIFDINVVDLTITINDIKNSNTTINVHVFYRKGIRLTHFPEYYGYLSTISEIKNLKDIDDNIVNLVKNDIVRSGLVTNIDEINNEIDRTFNSVGEWLNELLEFGENIIYRVAPMFI